MRPVHRASSSSRRYLHQLLSERRSAEPALGDRLRRDAGAHVLPAGGVRAEPGSSTSSAAAAARRPSTSAAIAEHVRDLAPRKVPAIEKQAAALRPRSAEHRRGLALRQRRRAHERHRLEARSRASSSPATTRKALAVARQQVENGAQVIDVNMDEAMLDSQAAMTDVPATSSPPSPTSRACR